MSNPANKCRGWFSANQGGEIDRGPFQAHGPNIGVGGASALARRSGSSGCLTYSLVVWVFGLPTIDGREIEREERERGERELQVQEQSQGETFLYLYGKM